MKKTTEIWAAIDLLQGSVVTLRKGDPKNSTVWSKDPIAISQRWEKEGATGLHIIDLDGALQLGSNHAIVESIISKANIPIQIGGGIRTETDLDRWLKSGAERVVLGTLAFENPATLTELLTKYGPEKIVIATDYKHGKITTKGWTRNEELEVVGAIKTLQDAKAKIILATAVELDGTALGPDLHTLQRIRAITNMHLIASGGVRTISDIHALEQIGVNGIIIGRALYEGTVNLNELKLKTK